MPYTITPHVTTNRDKLSVVKYLFPGNSKKRIPFQIKIELSESLKSRVTVERSNRGRIVKTVPPEVVVWVMIDNKTG